MKKLIAISILSFVSSMSMAATVTFPEPLTVRAIDGQSQPHSKQIEVAPGQHLLELQLFEDYSANADESKFIQSKALYWSLTLKNDDAVTVTIPPLLSTREAKDFLTNPVITINSASIKDESVKLVNHEQLMSIIMKQHNMIMASQ